MLQSGLCYSLGCVESGLKTVWVTVQSWLCYSLGYVTVWVMLQSGLSQVWVKDSLGSVNLGSVSLG